MGGGETGERADPVLGAEPCCRSSSSNRNLYSCIEAWYEGGGGRYWNSGYIIAGNKGLTRCIFEYLTKYHSYNLRLIIRKKNGLLIIFIIFSKNLQFLK